MFRELSKQVFNDLHKVLQKTGEGINQSQLHRLLENAISKQGLVTREEFDAQKAVLLRTREKLEALEAEVLAMEQQAAKQKAEK